MIEGYADALILPAFPHESRVPLVGLTIEEAHVEVGDVHFCGKIVAAEYASLDSRACKLTFFLGLERSTHPYISLVPFY